MIGIYIGLGLTSGAGGGVPFGYTRTTYLGQNVTYNGRAVFDDGHGLFILGAL